MKLNYINFKPGAEQKKYLEHEFEMLARDLSPESSFIINIKHNKGGFTARATVFENHSIIQGEMTGRTLEIIAPSLVVELRSKLAWHFKRQEKPTMTLNA